MTPRQLLALTNQHHLSSAGSAPAAPRAPSNQGSAGWLMAVAQGLDRTRSQRRAPVG
jgi:hypothetical protein